MYGCSPPHDSSVVVCACVLAGPRAIKRYIRLMTARIDWNTSALRQQAAGDAGADADGDADSGATNQKSGSNYCKLVWTGTSGTRHFSGFRFEECASAVTARRFMHTKGLAHYWDMVCNSETLASVTNSAPLPGFAMAENGEEELDVAKLFAAGSTGDASM